jgi:hypothetical protein
LTFLRAKQIKVCYNHSKLCAAIDCSLVFTFSRKTRLKSFRFKFLKCFGQTETREDIVRDTETLAFSNHQPPSDHMRLDQNPFFRKVIVPWYDSEAACWVVIVFAGLVFLFALTGSSIAYGHPEYHRYRWVPMLLMAMSGGVIISTSVRLFKRYLHRYSKSDNA